MVELSCTGREVRTTLPGIVTNRNDIIKINIPVLIHIVGSMSGNIDAILDHGLYRHRVHPMGFHPGTIDLCPASSKVAQVGFRNLATATITGAQH